MIREEVFDENCQLPGDPSGITMYKANQAKTLASDARLAQLQDVHIYTFKNYTFFLCIFQGSNQNIFRMLNYN